MAADILSDSSVTTLMAEVRDKLGDDACRPRFIRTAYGYGENVLGRDEEATAWIDSPLSSRRHARIVVAEGRATLEDLGSKNGTRLNGERLSSPTVLADRDEVRIGDVVLTFRGLPGAAPTETEAES